MTPPEVPPDITAVVADQLRRFRATKGWSAQALADRCSELGMPKLNRSVIANIEARRRATIGIDEILLLARALDVAPLYMFLPLRPTEVVQVLPEQTASAEDAWSWFAGIEPLEGVDRARYFDETPGANAPAQRIASASFNAGAEALMDRLLDRVAPALHTAAETGDSQAGHRVLFDEDPT